MSDPADFILDFLRRHQFAKAEAAFKAELLSREDEGRFLLPSDNVSHQDLQLQSPGGVAGFTGEQKLMPSLQSDKLGGSKSNEAGSFSEEVRSPPEKQLYVEFEPRRVSYQDGFITRSQEFAFEDASTVPKGEAPEDRVTFPIEALGPVMQGTSWQSSHKQEEAGALIGRNCETQAKSEQDEHIIVRSDETMNEERQSKPTSTFCVSQFHAQHQEYHTDELQKELDPYMPESKQPAHKNEDKATQSDLLVGGQQVVDRKEHCREVSLEVQTVVSTDPLNEEIHENTDPRILLPLSLLKAYRSDREQRSSSLEKNNSVYGKSGKKSVWDCENVEAVTSLSGNSRVSSHSNTLELHPTSLHESGELPRLAPVRLHSIAMEVLTNDGQHTDENGMGEDALGSLTSMDNLLVQDLLPTSGSKRSNFRSSVSQGIVGALSNHVPGISNAADGWYPDEYCDLDTYEDDDDPGYHRQPIADEDWFLAHEIDHPSDDERARQFTETHNVKSAMQTRKVDEDEQSGGGEDSYFSGEEYYRLQAAKKDYNKPQFSVSRRSDSEQLASINEHPSQAASHPITLLGVDRGAEQNQGRAFDAEELLQMQSQPIWKGFVGRSIDRDEDDVGFDGYKVNTGGVDDDNQESVRSGGMFVSSDIADVGSELRDSLLGGSSEGDESLRDQDLSTFKPKRSSFDSHKSCTDERESLTGVRSASMPHLEASNSEHDMVLQYYNEAWGLCKRATDKELASRNTFQSTELSKSKHLTDCRNMGLFENGGSLLEGFSFPSPSSTGEVAVSTAGSLRSLRSTREGIGQVDEFDRYARGMVGPDDTVAAWKQKSNNSSPIVYSSEDNLQRFELPNYPNGSSQSIDYHDSLQAKKHGNEGSELGYQLSTRQPSVQEEEDTLVGQEEMRMLNEYDDQFEIFNLRVIHRKNRTGFEEDKDFPVLINSVVAGRYHVTEYLGSAAFSKAIQAHDLHTGMDVCMKIIKNNKDFFDQSLDEIKLLKFINKHDPVDKYHILRLYDYFYHREHLFIVCELLRANLYEFHKFNRESGGEVYFTMPRLQSITRQCLEALEFLHGLGIIHCDLKPENILVKSYSRCEIKIIDLGSSCFQTDQLCSYVQSRSYRAPEVILGLPYDQKIDIWSLGCILAELCTGNVLFQNDSLATMLARVVGILGPIDPEVLAEGRDTHKYFTKNHMIYARNQETDQLEYLIPKRSSLSHRLPLGDHGFVEFVRYLLESNPYKRPTATEALQHPWLFFPYEPISS
ncbi:hypothetical protein GOP47_0002561 [Adiantum capillus-veneris]|uniref:Protein kinase domain-containing protein n=1 Tax=Adiantum capillus-veneris TaxID=13818 RepID=A0A9D4VC08_ADICA|nr:hypothetical protein GOP47_0002561 [Adiantum capillus-veneris]